MSEVLETGDCAYIESEMTMAFSAAGKHRCRVLAVTPPAQHAPELAEACAGNRT
jgi:hypothetical protein